MRQYGLLDLQTLSAWTASVREHVNEKTYENHVETQPKKSPDLKPMTSYRELLSMSRKWKEKCQKVKGEKRDDVKGDSDRKDDIVSLLCLARIALPFLHLRGQRKSDGGKRRQKKAKGTTKTPASWATDGLKAISCSHALLTHRTNPQGRSSPPPFYTLSCLALRCFAFSRLSLSWHTLLCRAMLPCLALSCPATLCNSQQSAAGNAIHNTAIQWNANQSKPKQCNAKPFKQCNFRNVAQRQSKQNETKQDNVQKTM